MPATEPEPRGRQHLERHDLDVARDAGDADAVVRDLRDRAGHVRAVAVVVVRRACCWRRSRTASRTSMPLRSGEQRGTCCSPRSATPVSSTATITPLPSASFHASGMPIWRMCHCFLYSGSFGKPSSRRARRGDRDRRLAGEQRHHARRARRSRPRGAAASAAMIASRRAGSTCAR